ncbi:conjugal transfer protein TrbA [Elizabethkingia miricola]|uniref:HTH cro/C1-type domain-containing protein n=1 Tax=Elizabethkingia miricola TaxID=172045 RepID=A0ABD4DTV1_ELIMR|nr:MULTISPECIES: helix-turn-helix transcriptional regulator [Elizabethkingia]KUY20887.1 hypothetical protein ATB95_08295 [Elizabethkingia miricola]MCL1654253.1 helix-turn-helix domain-containing protein [Elizabethkingia miricola]MCL1671729.1 helix-turn-helix domain-containing protein [Elizabethkingia ursingii]QCO45828.1 helix-turn-helix transcriptional regulator [Elizabethkingia sp. 2-6]CAH1143451.1 hypothetical protein EAVNVB490_01382 [Elizabethkingia anophelis]
MLDIERVLKEKSISKAKLAELLEVNRSYVTNVLNGNNPNLSTLTRIADALEVEVKDLFRSKKEKQEVPLYTKDESGKEIIIGYLKK